MRKAVPVRSIPYRAVKKAAEIGSVYIVFARGWGWKQKISSKAETFCPFQVLSTYKMHLNSKIEASTAITSLTDSLIGWKVELEGVFKYAVFWFCIS